MGAASDASAHAVGIRTVIFDLDGTLVDSAPSICDSLREALAKRHVTPIVEVDASLVGPPLMQTLHRASGIDDPLELEMLAAAFRDHYDNVACLSCQPFPGIRALLESLEGLGLDMAIATNKRILPARNILDRLGLSRFFTRIASLDAYTPALPDKGALLATILRQTGSQAAATCYVGDTQGDRIAAEVNGLHFAFAGWGYGSPASGGGWHLDRPAALLGLLETRH